MRDSARHKMMQRVWTAAAGAVMVLATALPGPGTALAASRTLWVNDDRPVDPQNKNCDRPGYNTIQDAVTAAQPGDTVRVCEGTYPEQVRVDKSLRLLGSGDTNTIIKAPPAMTPDSDGDFTVVRIAGSSTNVEFSGFTVSGPGPAVGCGPIFYGIFVRDGARAAIHRDTVSGIKLALPALFGCQTGVAIRVGARSRSTTGSATIDHNVITDYQKGGIVVDNTGSSAEIDHNDITGIGATTVIAQNGVQVSRGAVAEVHHNNISGNTYTPPTDDATGILLFSGTGGVAVHHNKLSANGLGIGADADHGADISHNDVSDSLRDGIFLLDGTTGESVSDNRSDQNGRDGIRVEAGSTGNTLAKNHMQDNGEHDAHDDNRPANVWTDNHCDTDFPTGTICK